MSADDERDVEHELPPVTAPTFPTEHVLNDSHTFFQRVVSGGMLVKFVPLVHTRGGVVPAPDAYCISFSPEGWERFKTEVLADGAKAPVIETARSFPGDLLNGGGQV